MNRPVYYLFGITLCLFLLTIACKKRTIKEVIPNETGTVNDISGVVYKTVKIGNQWWMAENLRVTKFNDGTDIVKIAYNVNDTTWKNQQQAAYCEVEEGQTRFGYYYNWNVISDIRKIAPKGWHIPSDEEWKILEQTLGMTIAEANESGWRGKKEAKALMNGNFQEAANDREYNTSGFNALPVGCRLFNGGIGDGGSYFWTSTIHENEGRYRYFSYPNTKVFRYRAYKTYGFSVRCIKD